MAKHRRLSTAHDLAPFRAARCADPGTPAPPWRTPLVASGGDGGRESRGRGGGDSVRHGHRTDPRARLGRRLVRSPPPSTHPFYRRWEDGTLADGELAAYAEQSPVD